MPVRGEGGGLRSLTRTPVVAGGPEAPPALSKCAVTVTILDSRGSGSGERDHELDAAVGLVVSGGSRSVLDDAVHVQDDPVERQRSRWSTAPAPGR